MQLLRACLAVATAACLASPLPAKASRGPTPAERAALSRFVISYVEHAGDGCCAHGLRARVAIVRVSTTDRHWAVVGVRIWDKSGREGQPFSAVMHIVRRSWTVFDLGGDMLGCGVPRGVADDLALSGAGYC